MSIIGTRSTANYRSAVAALHRLAPLDPTLRARRSMSRVVAQHLLPTNLEPLTYAFEELLGESAASARRLIHDWFFYRHLESVSWIDARHRPRGVLRDAARIADYIDACPRGVVVASIHLGDYLEGLRQLRLGVATRKRILVVRRRAWSEVEARAFARTASTDAPLTILRTGSGAASTAVRALRRGDIVVVLYDLPSQFGRTVEVDFFGRRAQRRKRSRRNRGARSCRRGADVHALRCGWRCSDRGEAGHCGASVRRFGTRGSDCRHRAAAVRAGGTTDSRASEPVVALDVRARAALDRTGASVTSGRYRTADTACTRCLEHRADVTSVRGRRNPYPIKQSGGREHEDAFSSGDRSGLRRYRRD